MGRGDAKALDEMVAVCEEGLEGWPDGLRKGKRSWNRERSLGIYEKIAKVFLVDPMLDVNAYFYENDQFEYAMERDATGHGIHYNGILDASVSMISGELDRIENHEPATLWVVFIRDYKNKRTYPVWKTKGLANDISLECEFICLRNDLSVLLVLRKASTDLIIRDFLQIKEGEVVFEIHLPPSTIKETDAWSGNCTNDNVNYLVSQDQNFFFARFPDGRIQASTWSIDLTSHELRESRIGNWTSGLWDLGPCSWIHRRPCQTSLPACFCQRPL